MLAAHEYHVCEGSPRTASADTQRQRPEVTTPGPCLLPRTTEATFQMMGQDPPLGKLYCPACGQSSEVAVPTDACLYFYECPGCRLMLKPKPGDCCVFCSYGGARCPPRGTLASLPLGSGEGVEGNAS